MQISPHESCGVVTSVGSVGSDTSVGSLGRVDAVGPRVVGAADLLPPPVCGGFPPVRTGGAVVIPVRDGVVGVLRWLEPPESPPDWGPVFVVGRLPVA